MTTTDFTFTFRGTNRNLDMFVFSGCKYYSKMKILNGELKLTYMTEDGDHDACMDCINMDEADRWNVEYIAG